MIDLSPFLSLFILNDPSNTQHAPDLFVYISAQIAAIESIARQESSVMRHVDPES